MGFGARDLRAAAWPSPIAVVCPAGYPLTDGRPHTRMTAYHSCIIVMQGDASRCIESGARSRHALCGSGSGAPCSTACLQIMCVRRAVTIGIRPQVFTERVGWRVTLLITP